MSEPADNSPVRLRFEEWAIDHGFSTRRFSGAVYPSKDPQRPTPLSYGSADVCAMWRGYWAAAKDDHREVDTRRDLAEKILLKLIEVSPAATMASEEGEGIRLAWQIADAFLKAEKS